MPHPSADSEDLESLALQALGGCTQAQHRLLLSLWPDWQRLLARAPALRGWADQEDIENILVSLAERLSGQETRALKSYPGWKERNPEKSFRDWSRIVLANMARDYARRWRPQRGASSPETPSVPAVLNEFLLAQHPESLSTRPPYTNKQTARQLLEFAANHLSGEQSSALSLWLSGHSHQEVGERLGLSPQGAERCLRAALARLRREFASLNGLSRSQRPSSVRDQPR